MRKTVFCAVFLLIVAITPASSALIPYTITGTYYDWSTEITHQVFGSIIIENQPSQFGHIRNTLTGEYQEIEIHSGSGYWLEDVIDWPISNCDQFIMTHYAAYSFSLTSLNDPSVSWYREHGFFRFETSSFESFYPADKYSNIFDEIFPYTVPDLRYYFYYSDMTPYNLHDWWSWHHNLAPVIKAHDIFGVDPHGPDGQGLFWNLTLTRSAPVPEPATLLLFGSGLAGLAAIGRRRRK